MGHLVAHKEREPLSSASQFSEPQSFVLTVSESHAIFAVMLPFFIFASIAGI